MRFLILVGFAALVISGCSPRPAASTDSETTASAIADGPVQAHNYLTAEAGGYTYSAALTDDQRRAGEGAEKVVFLKYMGAPDGNYTFVDENGSAGFYCENPCVVIKQTVFGRVVDRIGYNPKTIAGAAIQDAANGYLAPYVPNSNLPAASADDPSPEVAALLTKESALNEECRGGNHTPDDQVCQDRDAADKDLEAHGWCYGEGATSGADSVWAPCRRNAG